MESCELKLDGRAVGRVSWYRQDNRVVVRARCPAEDGKVYRVRLSGGGQSLALGVMMPQDGLFLLRRTLPERQCGLLLGTADVRAEVIRTQPGEIPPDRPAGPLGGYRPTGPDFQTTDSQLNAAIVRQGDVLYTQNDGLRLAYPLAIGKSSPFAAFFAVTRCAETGGGLYGMLELPKVEVLCRRGG